MEGKHCVGLIYRAKRGNVMQNLYVVLFIEPQESSSRIGRCEAELCLGLDAWVADLLQLQVHVLVCLFETAC